MLRDLPIHVNLLHLAQQQCHLKGHIALAMMSRLQDSLYAQAGTAYIEWQFALDRQQRPSIRGFIETQLPLQCQRCLQLFYWPVNTPVALLALHPGQTEQDLPKGYEEIILPSAPVTLAELVEDELILALPIVAMHDFCPEPLLPDEEMQHFIHSTDHPFKKLLKTLKKN
jgi:uncharacterized protein